MKHLIKTTKYFLLAFFVTFNLACSTEDGEQGPQGESGEDGNANVIMKTVESVTWSSGSYLGVPSSIFEINDTDINQNVMDNSLILVYFQLFGEDIWYPMTYNFTYSDGDNEIVTFTYSLNKLTLYSFQSGSVLNAGISKVRYFIIESSNGDNARQNLSDLSYEEVLNITNIKP